MIATGPRLALAVAASLISVAAAELATRWLALAPAARPAYGSFAPDPHLPFRPEPLSHATGRTDEFVYDYRHNGFGFRDAEHAMAKPAGVFRILGLGDSFTYGVGVPFDETYLARLERMLDATGTQVHVEVIKAGIPRYFPAAERMLLESYGLAFHPDLVTVAFVPNDVIDTYLGLDAVTVSESGYLMTREAKELGETSRWLYQSSHLGRLVLRRYLDWRLARKFSPRLDEVYRPNGFHEADWRAIEQDYAQMAVLTKRIGARLIILHIPQKGPWKDDAHYPADRLKGWAHEHDVGFVDLLPSIERAAETTPLYFERDGHTNSAGHAIIAREVVRFLEEQKWVP